MKLSVVIPAYNEEKYLPGCLESLKNQTFRDFEIIVIDNNSTDTTAEIAMQHGVNIIHEAKKGVGAARKKGFSQARGEIIVSTDADCTFPPDWLEKIAHAFENPNTIAVYGTTIIEDPSIWKRQLSYYVMNIFYQINDRLNKKQFQGSNSAVRKTAYEKTTGYDSSLGALEDADLCKKLMKIATPSAIFFDPSIKIITSARRLKNGNFLKSLWTYLTWYYQTWWKQSSKKIQTVEDIR